MRMPVIPEVCCGGKCVCPLFERYRLTRGPAWAYAAAMAAMLFVREVFGVLDVSIFFIYFQF